MRFFGSLGFRYAKKEREKTIRHLTQVFGKEKSAEEIYQIARNVFLHFSTVAADAIRLPLIVKEGINNYVSRVINLDVIKETQKAGNGCIFLTGHVGNWELLGAWFVQNGFHVKVVGTSSYDPRMDALIVNGRNQAGYTNIARGKGTREIVRHLRGNGFLGILIDQDTKVEGVFVNFFGKAAHTATGPVTLSQKLKVPIVPVFLNLRRNLTYVVEALPSVVLVDTGNSELDLIANTQKCSDSYEYIIKKYPEQWVWMHERWKKQPENQTV